jgi:hypothetical protein
VPTLFHSSFSCLKAWYWLGRASKLAVTPQSFFLECLSCFPLLFFYSWADIENVSFTASSIITGSF